MTILVRVLGSPSVERAGVPVALGGSKPRLLIALLVAHVGKVLSADRLCDALWGDEPPPTAASSLQSHVSRLRSKLGPEITIEAHALGYRLLAPIDAIDATRFARAVDIATENADSPSALETLRETLSWWDGPAFGEFATHEYIQAEAVRLDEMRLAATERLIEARLDAGGDEALIGDLGALVVAHPLRERLWRQLMLALYRAGRQTEALRRGAELSAFLRENMGLDPPELVRDLERRILEDDPSLHLVTRPSSQPVDALVDAPTRLIGRDHDLALVSSLMRNARLVTLVGPGGVGKTRIARRIAVLESESGEAVTMVDLAVLRDPASVPAAVATALHVQPRQQGSVEETLEVVLGERRILVVLDNCEHVIEAAAALASRLTSACRAFRIIATSREPLGVPGEAVYSVKPLETGDASDVTDTGLPPAVQLFCERAAAARPGFTATAAELPVIAQLCRRLDGLPLAIELAAVRMRSLPPRTIIERLEKGSGLLDAGPRHPEQRHRNLERLVAWSFDLLPAQEQLLFARLSVFAGTFDLTAVDGVCIDTGDSLFSLVDKSMVQVTDYNEPRYQLLETLRQYGSAALEGSADAKRTADRHLTWFSRLAQQAGDGMSGESERRWSDRIDRDFANLRAAHAHAVASGNVGAALGLVAAVREYGFRRISYEISSWSQIACDMPGASTHESYPVALATVAYGHYVRGDLEGAVASGREAVAAADRLGASTNGLAERALGNTYFYLGQTDEALRWMDRMVEAAETSGSDAQKAHAYYMRSVAETSVGDPDGGGLLAQRSQRAALACMSPTALAQASYALGLALESTDLAASQAYLLASAEHAAAAANRWVEAFARTEVWWLQARIGNVADALKGFEDVIETWYRGGDWANQWLSVRHLFGILQQVGDHEAAAVLHGGLTAAGAAAALPFEPADAARLEAAVEMLRLQLGDEDFSRAFSRGAAMSDHAFVSYVLDHIRARAQVHTEY